LPVVVVGLLEIQGLLQETGFAIAASLSAVSLGRLEILPEVLLEAGVLGVILPVAVLADDAGLVGNPSASPVLACLEEDVVTRLPAGGVHLISRIFLVGDGVGAPDERFRLIALVERHLPEEDRGMIAIATNELADFAEFELGESRIGIEVLPAHEAVHDQQAELVTGVEKGRSLGVV